MLEAQSKIKAHLSSSPHFVDVVFLPNFQLDHDNSLLHQTEIYKGLIVSLSPEYVVTSKDKMWLHPNIAQCRALFNGGAYQHTTGLPLMNASAGIYRTNKIDALGDEIQETFTVVDTHLTQEWEGSLQEIYSNKYQTEVLNECKNIAETLGTGELCSASYTNMLYRGSNTFHFYNAAYKDQGLVLLSPLIGYCMVDQKDHPADFINETEHLVNLTPQQLQSIYTKCNWEGHELINTAALKQALPLGADGTQYRTVQISIARTPVQDLLTAQQHLAMTPLMADIPTTQSCHNYLRQNKIRLPYNEENIQKLLQLKDEFPILNMYSNGQLTLSREIVAKII